MHFFWHVRRGEGGGSEVGRRWGEGGRGGGGGEGVRGRRTGEWKYSPKYYCKDRKANGQIVGRMDRQRQMDRQLLIAVDSLDRKVLSFFQVLLPPPLLSGSTLPEMSGLLGNVSEFSDFYASLTVSSHILRFTVALYSA